MKPALVTFGKIRIASAFGASCFASGALVYNLVKAFCDVLWSSAAFVFPSS